MIGLAYVGKIIALEEIPNADKIVSATVICGVGGKWKGVVRKSDFSLFDMCVVFLPDSLLPHTQQFSFMESRGWRVMMSKFKGVASEVLIMPLTNDLLIGADLTLELGVTKYQKPIPANLQGIAIGEFPSFMPKTDELNYQTHWDVVEKLEGNPYYTTLKMDGSSTTAYKYKRKFGICSRNLELEWKPEENGYCKVADRYSLKEKLPEGIALQWETCGPKIQGNKMGLKDIDGYAFAAYDIGEKRYLEMKDLCNLCCQLSFPMVDIVDKGEAFSSLGVELLGEGQYSNGKEREGVVVRSQVNINGDHPISFKVINLNYED